MSPGAEGPGKRIGLYPTMGKPGQRGGFRTNKKRGR
jgi:hypothetical protein